MFEDEISVYIETVSSGENSLCIMFYKCFILYDEVLKNYILIYYTVYLFMFNVFGNFKSKLQNSIFCYLFFNALNEWDQFTAICEWLFVADRLAVVVCSVGHHDHQTSYCFFFSMSGVKYQMWCVVTKWVWARKC